MTGTEQLSASSSMARLDTRQGRWIVTGMVLGFAVTFLSATVTNIALPSIGADLGTDLAGLQWVVSAYLLALASLLLPAGSAGDILGRRKTFLAGIGIFAMGSLACAVSPTLLVLVIARLVQGAGAALMTSANLAIIDASFHPDDRSQAITTWVSGSALAASAGPLLGGFVVDAISWRWIFLAPLPLVAATIIAARQVPETRDDTLGRHLDLPSAALALMAVAGIVFAIVQGPVDGFTELSVVAAGAVGGLAAVGFVIAQRRRSDPMVPPRLFRSTQFSGVNVFTLLVDCAVGAVFFFTAIQFQVSFGYTALAAGAALLPMNFVMIVGSPRAGALASRYGPRWLVTTGPVVAAGGLVALALVGDGDSYILGVLPGVLLLGLGLATMVGPLTASVFGAVAERDVGMASAVNNAVAKTGSLLAVALLPAAAGVSNAADAAGFSDGYQRAMLIAAGLFVVSAFIGGGTIGRCVARVHTAQQAGPTSGCVQRSLPEAA